MVEEMVWWKCMVEKEVNGGNVWLRKRRSVVEMYGWKGSQWWKLMVEENKVVVKAYG